MRLYRLSLWGPWLLSVAIATWSLPAASYEDRTLTGGWIDFPPFSYVETTRGISRWRGLDVELLQEIAEKAGYTYDSPLAAMDWPNLVGQIETGERDMVAIATRTPEREEFARFSIPYRTESMVLILPRGTSDELPIDNDVELVKQIDETNFILGVATGIAYPSAAFRAFVADPANQDQLVTRLSRDLLQELLSGHIDGFLSDRIVAAEFIKTYAAGALVEEHPVKVDGPVYLMFSKVSVPPEVVEDFNLAIEQVHADGTYRRLNEKYAFPILVSVTLHSRWFFIVDILGTIAFALSGLLLALRDDYDIFGALVLAALPAVGGGVIRDLLTNREQLAVLASPIYLEIVIGLVVGGFIIIRVATAARESRFGTAAAGLFGRRRDQVNFLVQAFDAVGLAAFTVTGVVVALATHSQPLWLWGPLLAAITAAGGGILRDVVRSDPHVNALMGELYPEIAVVWGAILSLYLGHETDALNADKVAFGIVATFIGAFVTRVAVIYFGIRSPLMLRRSRPLS